jgi:hypothetical protein
MRIGDGEGGIGREAALGVGVAAVEEVHADWRVGIGARLDILRAGSGGNKRRGQDERPEATSQEAGQRNISAFAAIAAGPEVSTCSVRVGNANSTPTSLARSMTCNSIASRSLSSTP